MAGSSHGFDALPTEVQRDPFAGSTQLARALVRLQPEVTWSGPGGTGSLSLGERAAVGSAPGNDLVIEDKAVSRIHCELSLREQAVWVRDLGSRNGTFVQGVQVLEAKVGDGARVRLGNTELLVRYGVTNAEVELWPTDHFGPLLGGSVAMREHFARLARIARDDSTVLVQGETGTGKELVAQALHQQSSRASAPFVVVDCGALPENLLEAELFGYVRGAFTGATHPRAGAFECAEGGTVFLDEIGELPLSMQPKLLRVLESRTVRRLGEWTQRPVDVRVVSATHRDLRTMVNTGAFREDLYFRLAILPVTVPPLRARVEDIPQLVRAFLASSGTSSESPGAELLAELAQRPWIGNVRELRNFVARARVLGAGDALQAMGPPSSASHATPAASAGSAEVFPPVDVREPFRELRTRWIDHLEREYVRELLDRHAGNISAVAKAAGLDRTYIHRLVRKHDL